MSIDFAVITALSLERRAVCTALGLADENRVTRGGRVYWRGRLPLPDDKFYEIAVAQPSDLANVDAALVTSAAISEWHPQALLFVGIAGAATDEVELGDVVFGRRVYYYERGKVGNTHQLEPVTYPADAQLLNVAMSKEDWKEPILLPRPDGSTSRPIIRIGDIASGEKVIAEGKARDELVSRDRRILAIEMEGYGFSSAVWQSANKERHLILRVVCDRADRDKNQDWQPYASAVGAAIMLDFLRDSSVRSQFEPRTNLLADQPRFDRAVPKVVELGEPRDIFISHAGEDEKVVQRLAKGLEREGFTTWYYERDNTFLETHLVQTKRAIDRAKVVVVLASPHSVHSHDVTTELQVAHSSAKPVAPLLLELTWNQIKEQNELWTIIFGAATALTLDAESVIDILPRIVAGLTAWAWHRAEQGA